jgi:hypothetical protein
LILLLSLPEQLGLQGMCHHASKLRSERNGAFFFMFTLNIYTSTTDLF